MQKIYQTWNYIEKLLSGLLLFSSVIIVLYAVFMRYVMHAAPEWTEELVIYLVVWAVYIISSLLAEERGHVGATFIVEFIPIKIRRFIEVGTGILCLFFSMMVVYYGLFFVDIALKMGEVSASTLRFPMWIAYLAIPVGMILFSFRIIIRLYFLIFKFSDDLIIDN